MSLFLTQWSILQYLTNHQQENITAVKANYNCDFPMGCLALFPEQCAKGRIDCFNWLDSPKGNSLVKVCFFSPCLQPGTHWSP